jgi:RimJ/RimL family protein N-acetyltransferase|tara:strand:- start:45264 stop:45833 length:570 start_codon:yes stop_codon:yes gene_type:complete
MYTLETERLILRPFDKDDIAFLDYLHSDAEVTRYTSGRTRSHAENVAYIITMLDLYTRDIGHLLVLRKSDNMPVGRCGLFTFYGINDGERDWYYFTGPQSVRKPGEIFELIELGYSFARDYWGQGYATEAATVVRDYAFEHLGYESLSSLVIKENTASIRVAQKMGADKAINCMLNERPALNLIQKKTS